MRLMTASEWTPFRNGGITWNVRPCFAAPFREWIAAHFDGAGWIGTTPLKQDTGSRVLEAGGWVIKESTRRRGRGLLRFGLRRSGSRRAFVLAQRLLARKIATPEPVAWATVRRNGIRVRDYLITVRLSETENLQARCRRLATDPKGRAATLSAVGDLLARFHASGLANRDLKDENILCACQADPVLSVVDLDGVRAFDRVSTARARADFWPIVRSLRRLGWADPADQAALLAAYNAGVPPLLRLNALPHLSRRDPGVRLQASP